MVDKVKKDARGARRAEAKIARASTAIVEAPPPLAQQEVGTLKPRTRFELDGDLYELHSLEPEFAVINKLERSPDGKGFIPRWQRPAALNTLVRVKTKPSEEA